MPRSHNPEVRERDTLLSVRISGFKSHKGIAFWVKIPAAAYIITMLLIDCHEPNSIIENIKLEVPIKVISLKYGDYSFSDTVIERKTLSDFFSSIKSKRLQEQMENISRHYSEKYLLVEGFFDFSYVNNIAYLYSQIIQVTLNSDIKVLFTKDCKNSAALIKRIYFKNNLGYTKNITKKDKVYYTRKLFDISDKKLEILFSKFGNIKNIANANKKELRGIKSVGKKTIEKIRNKLESNIFQTL